MDDNFFRPLAKLALTAAAESKSERLALAPNGNVCIGDWQIGSKVAQGLIEREALISFLFGVRAATYQSLKDLDVDVEDVEA